MGARVKRQGAVLRNRAPEFFPASINWDNPPEHVKAEIERRKEAVQLMDMQQRMQKGISLARRIIACRMLGYPEGRRPEDGDSVRSLCDLATTHLIRRTMEIYGPEAHEQIAREAAQTGRPFDPKRELELHDDKKTAQCEQ